MNISNSTLSIQETPRSARSDGHDVNQTDLRSYIGREMDNEMVVCDLLTFQQCYLPFVPCQDEVRKALQGLSPNYLQYDQNDEHKWVDLEQPSLYDGNEAKVFAPLKDVFEALEKYKFSGEHRGRRCKFRFRQHPYKTLSSDIAGGTHIIDGSFSIHKEVSEEPLATADVAVSAEFKARHNLNTVRDNRLKIVGAASHIMNDDVRRMFTFGITIEDERMTLWYFSRSHSAKSESFNFIEDKESLIAIALSFMFASEEEMGYDPLVTLSEDGSYIYRFPQEGGRSRSFKTCHSLAEYRSLCITGRMNRVWEVIELGPMGQPLANARPVALKDVWLDEAALTERQIQNVIFEDVRAFARSDFDNNPCLAGFSAAMRERLKEVLQNERYRHYFLHIECDYQGKSSKEVPQSAKPQRGIFVPPLSTTQPSSRALPDPTRKVVSGPSQRTNPRKYVPKRRYLLVYREVCRALHDLDSLPDVLGVLQDCLIALQLLYCAGWVHRDISSGNILAFKDIETNVLCGKLSDLEYAKKFPSSSGSANVDPKTGTPFFMPYEIQRHQYLHERGETLPEFNEDHLPSRDDVKRTTARLPIRHNFQHDLESLWWVLLWTVTQGINHEPSRTFASEIFRNEAEPPPARADVFLDSRYLMMRLDESLHPGVQEFSIPFVTAIISLREGYRTREMEEKLDDIGSYSNAYRKMGIILKNLKKIIHAPTFAKVKLDLCPQRPP
ncbi:hypothetical protein AX17_003731 [Amanita inopinata Kibby_2008]|nr:hypothetical protein AX17_003731 [Amanita inopinata Kibby_2008]